MTYRGPKPPPPPSIARDCPRCGDAGVVHPNGTFTCPNMACLNFPYMTELNKAEWEKVLGVTHE